MSSNYDKKNSAKTFNRLPLYILMAVVALFIVADVALGFDFIWVDYAIVIIIALFGLKGYIKGIINTVFSLAGYVVGLIMAYLFSSKVSLLIMQKTELGNTIRTKINDLMPALSKIGNFKTSDAESVLDLFEKIPELNNAILDNPLLEQLMKVTKTASDSGALYNETVVTINDLIVYSILNVIAFIVLFTLIKLLVVLLGRLLTNVLKSTAILGTANRTGGLALGLATGLLICYIAFVYAIPALGAINIIKVPENYTDSLILIWFNKFTS